MGDRQGLRTRPEGRHWLPSQGVDPAPLTELNAECLGLLATAAADGPPDAPVPPLIAQLRDEWAGLSTLAVRRLSAAPYSLFDVGIAQAGSWLERRVTGVHEQAQRSEPPYFELPAARSITRRTLVYAWHLARSRPRAACLVFGTTIDAVESLAASSLSALEIVAERNADSLRPRWPAQVSFWRALLAAASADTDIRLQELLLGGIQRLAAETLTAHIP
jgi:hypothetical protein